MPSPSDVKSMKVNDVELTVAIKKKSKNVPWRYEGSKKMLSVVLGEFRFEIVAYTRIKSNSQPIKNWTYSAHSLSE